jgi:hypothetical protein
MRNPCLDAALAELEAVGIRDFQLARGGKHLQLRWSVNGHPTRMLVVPVTPSDWRSDRNTRRDIRALLRLDGLLDETPRANGGNGAHASWRQEVRTLAQRLRQVNIPDQQLAGERNEIVAALRRLTTEGSEP